jgi:hypothetical protein
VLLSVAQSMTRLKISLVEGQTCAGAIAGRPV